ncbi:MAG: class I SAM-dependent RNA methyltransferase [Bacteroidia bacterium]|nr:class I SAM-dependent RNA methyltransferase [Bacteroidia bacterium]
MNKILITCANRTTPYLAQEIEQLGFSVVSEYPSAVEIQGTFHDTYTLNLHLRTANRVLYWIKDFVAFNAEDLYAKVLEIPWEKYLNPESYLTVDSIVDNPTIINSLYPNVKCKDAIVDRMSQKIGKRPNSGPEPKGAVVFLYWKNNDVSVYLDTSGEVLSKHSYRKYPFQAPLQESLAASIILAAEWDKNTHFINPMTGSGTLAIEAAMMALNKPPGILRNNFAFMHYQEFDKKIWSAIRRKANAAVKKNLDIKIIATDINPDAIQAAQANAAIAGVQQYIQFKVCDFRQTPIPQDKKGIIIFNPEYGMRLGQEENLKNTYQAIGDFLKQKCQGYTGYIFTGNDTLTKYIGLHASKKIPFYNAKIECKLLKYELYEGSKNK